MPRGAAASARGRFAEFERCLLHDRAAGIEHFLDGSPDQGANDRPNATQTIALVTTATAEELDELEIGEDRKTVLAAIAKRRTELQGGN